MFSLESPARISNVTSLPISDSFFMQAIMGRRIAKEKGKIGLLEGALSTPSNVNNKVL